MIKRIQLVARRPAANPADFARAWLAAEARAQTAAEMPDDARPRRAVACVAYPEPSRSPAQHAAIAMQWFSGRAALERFECWQRSAAGQRADAAAAALRDKSASCEIWAEERVMRGCDWLTQRWATSAVMLKHMALARRAAGVSASQLSARWRERAGTIGAAAGAPALAIPEPAKGRAYIQNHPLVCERVWPYDAINEVYFEPGDRTGLCARIDFFREHDITRAEADLFAAPNFVVVAESLIYDRS